MYATSGTTGASEFSRFRNLGEHGENEMGRFATEVIYIFGCRGDEFGNGWELLPVIVFCML